MASSQSFSSIQRRISLSPLAGVACEERGAIHDDGDAAAALGRVLHARQQVLQEEQLPVADARRACSKAASLATRGLGLDSRLVHLPLFAIGRIGEQVVKVLARVLVAAKACCRT